MIVKGINDTPATAGRKPARLPVPIADTAPVGEDPQAKRGGRRYAERFRLRPVRPSAPFLAQLALQYDEAAFLRRARLERSEHAARVYAAGPAPRMSRGRKADISV